MYHDKQATKNDKIEHKILRVYKWHVYADGWYYLSLVEPHGAGDVVGAVRGRLHVADGVQV